MLLRLQGSRKFQGLALIRALSVCIVPPFNFDETFLPSMERASTRLKAADEQNTDNPSYSKCGAPIEVELFSRRILKRFMAW